MFQIDSIKYNIIKLDFCSEYKKISLLHYKEDAMYYVTIIDITENKVEIEIPLDLSFVSYCLDSIVPNSWGRRMSEIYPNYNAHDKFYHVNDNIARKFILLKDLKLFKVDFKTKQILLFIEIQEYSFKNSKFVDESIFDEYRFIIYDFKGEVIKQKNINKDRNEIKSVGLINPDKIFLYKDSWQNNLETFNYKDNSSCTFDLLDNDSIFREKEFCDYEYLEEIQSINNSNLIGYIGQHATYGAYGVQIIRYTETGLEPIYDLEIIDGGVYLNLTFNYSGSEFSVIEPNTRGKFLNIVAYSISEKDYNPKKVINTKYKYDDWFNILRYYTNNKIALVKPNKIVIYDLISGNLEIELQRNFISPFCISEDRILYFLDNKLMIYKE